MMQSIDGAMRKFFGLVLAFTLLLLPGCWSRSEPKTLALINSVIYDLDDSSGYKITMEITNPSAQGGPTSSGDGKSPNITSSGVAISLPEAVRNASQSLEREIFGGHIRVRLFSERFAQKDVYAVMDYILRDRLADENPLMVIIKNDDPALVYDSMMGLSDTLGDYIYNLSQSQPNATSKSVFVKTLEFVKDYYKEGKQPVAGVIELVECEEKPSQNTALGDNNSEGTQSQQQDSSGINYRIIYGGLAAFKDNKLVGYMDEIEARAYNLINNNINEAIISIVSESSQTVVSINNPKTDIKVDMQNDEVSVNIKIKTSLSIIQENSPLDISKADALKLVEAAFNKQIAEEATAAIQKAQSEFRSDIFGFGVSMHKQHPQKWKELKENWDDYFANANINVLVESTVDRSGEIKKPFKWEDES